MESLDMSAFTVRGVTGTRLGAQNSHLYDLAAVIVHHGSGYDFRNKCFSLERLPETRERSISKFNDSNRVVYDIDTTAIR